MLIVTPIASLNNRKLAAKLRSPTSPSAISNDTTNRGSTEGRRPSEAAIDPLSQVCPYWGSSCVGRRLTHDDQQILQRTNTSPAVHKLRSQNTDPIPNQTPASPNEAHVDKKQSGESPRDGGAYKADKK
jgi:hypothetical protein